MKIANYKEEIVVLKVKDIRPVLERQMEYFKDLQQIELKLHDNEELCTKLNEELGTVDILKTIVKARSSFYDNEILRRERMIDEAIIEDELLRELSNSVCK